MKIVGKNSLLFWIKYPFAIMAFSFVASALWILPLLINYAVAGNENRFTSIKEQTVNFHYPLTTMVLSTENSAKGLLLAFSGIVSVCFILMASLKIISALSKENFFTQDAVRTLKILGFGLLLFGVSDFIINLLYPHHFNISSSVLYSISGIIFIFLKEIFAEGKKKQDENELTI